LHRPHIGIDLLGSDRSPEELLPSLVRFSETEGKELHLTLFAKSDHFKGVSKTPALTPFPVEEEITMEDDPLVAFRRKKEASLCKGIQLLHEHKIDAFISAGNTGALLACSKLTLPMLSGILRPALLTLLPVKNKKIAVLDVGANIHCKAEHLFQFALMGIAYQKCQGVPRPVVGLLNIGTEAKKGTPQVREAYEQLLALNHKVKGQPPIFLGNVEGRDAFKGEIDVLVTDGFTGNIFLKTAEGIASVILDQLAGSPLQDSLRKELHYEEYPGAILCGVEGIVVKCHGNSTAQALINSIRGVIPLIQNSFLKNIKMELDLLL